MEEDKKSSAADRMRLRIMKGLLELLKTKHYSRISVTELTKAVGINRVTFYRYYIDVFDLFEKTQDYYADMVLDRVRAYDFSDLRSISSFATLFFTPEEFEVYCLLAGTNGSMYFLFRVCEAVCTVLTEKLSATGLLATQELSECVTFLVNGAVGMYLDTYINGKEPSDDILNIIFVSLSAMLGSENPTVGGISRES